MSKLQCIIIGLVLSLFACKKVETPPSTTGTPVFSITGNLAGDSLNITAGEDDYFLFTSFEKDADEVFSFIGTFAKIDCLDECQDTFRIKIRSNQPTPSNTVNINDALFVGDYLYRNSQMNFMVEMDTIYSYAANFDASASILANPANNMYEWTIGTENYAPVFIPNFSLDLPNQPDESIEALLKITSGNCVSTKQQTLNFEPDSITTTCFSTIVSGVAPSGDMILNALSTGVPPLTYVWSDGTVADTLFITDSIAYSVTVTDAVGCQDISSVFMDAPGSGDILCQATFSVASSSSFEIEKDTTFINDPLQLSTVTIEYIDENGVFYSSDLAEQSTNSNFSITEINDFDNNENGEKTKQLDVNFNCILESEAAVPPILLTNGTGKIGVAYPD